MQVTGYTPPERKHYQFDNFSGVDFTSPISASPRRSIAGRNFMQESGILRKRPGWESQAWINVQGNPQPINGMWHFWAEDRVREDESSDDAEKIEFFIVHAGSQIFRVDPQPDGAGTFETLELPEGATVRNVKSYAIFNDNRLYILCGDYLMFKQVSDATIEKDPWKICRVFNDEKTFVPTTVFNKGYRGEVKRTQEILETPNFLTTRRKNSFHASVTFYDASGNVTTEEKADEGSEPEYHKLYELDCKEFHDGDGGRFTDFQISATGVSGIENRTLVTYEYRSDPAGMTGNDLTGFVLPVKKYDPVVGTLGDAAGSIYLKTGLLRFADESALLEMNRIGETTDNLVVEFDAFPMNAEGRLIQNYEKWITDCRFGILFGSSGIDDRLFLAGNPNHPNVCFHSEANDFTYFPDENADICGAKNSGITGFSRLADGTLAVHKEPSEGDNTIFYQTSATTSRQSYTGMEIPIVYFPITAGAIGEGCVNCRTTANLADDRIMLSDHGVCGLVLATNVGTTERYARERSRTINDKLKTFDLSETSAVVYKNRYYLATGSGECFVADARHTFREKGDMPDSYNYEWYYLENVPARVWEIVGEELWFGTEDGLLCKFDEEFSDRFYQHTSAGDLSLEYPSRFVFNRYILDDLTESSTIRILSGNDALFLRIFANSELSAAAGNVRYTENGYIITDGMAVYAGIDRISDGSPIYTDETGFEMTADKEYEIREIDFSERTFELYCGEHKIVFPQAAQDPWHPIPFPQFYLYRKADSEEFETYNFYSAGSESYFQVRVPGVKTPAVFISRNEMGATGLTATMSFRKAVAAEWYTPMIDLGSDIYLKRLLTIDVTTEPCIDGKLEFGFVTRTQDTRYGGYSWRGLDFSALDFTDWTFEMNNFADTHRRKVLNRGFNFVMFRLASAEATDCAVNRFGFDYTVKKNFRGTR